MIDQLGTTHEPFPVIRNTRNHGLVGVSTSWKHLCGISYFISGGWDDILANTWVTSTHPSKFSTNPSKMDSNTGFVLKFQGGKKVRNFRMGFECAKRPDFALEADGIFDRAFGHRSEPLDRLKWLESVTNYSLFTMVNIG